MEQSKMKEFNVSRDKDDKDLFIQKEREFFAFDSMADTTLHIQAIMGAYSCLKAMFNISVKQLSEEKEQEIRKELEAIAAKYRSIRQGGASDTWEFFAGMQGDVNQAYRDLKEAMK